MGDSGISKGAAIPTVERREWNYEATGFQRLLQFVPPFALHVHCIEIGVSSLAKGIRMNGSDPLHIRRRKPLERPHVDDQVESLGTKRASEVVKRDGERAVDAAVPNRCFSTSNWAVPSCWNLTAAEATSVAVTSRPRWASK